MRISASHIEVMALWPDTTFLGTKLSAAERQFVVAGHPSLDRTCDTPACQSFMFCLRGCAMNGL